MRANWLTKAAGGLAGLLLGWTLLAGLTAVQAASDLEQGFIRPPDSARPWVYWFWLNGNITKEGITADLEAMRRVGIGGVLIMEVDQGAPVGPVDFMGDKWRELFKHVVAEAGRLGLEVNMNNDAGWNGSGGPWIKPEQSMQKVVWSELDVEGPRHVDADLKQPETVANYYRDITVLAFPTPGAYRMDNIHVKAGYQVGNVAPTAQVKLAPDMVIERDRIIDISKYMDKAGHLAWDAPAGKWTVLRLGHTSTGVQNAPAPATGRGLECDKLSKEGIEANYEGMMAKLIADVGSAAGKALIATHIDSWENGAQNWTGRMREEFQKRRGYDLLPLLPALTGRVIGSSDISERFLWDLRQTISELVVENYAGHLRKLAGEHGMRLSIEAYGSPTDDLPYAGQADEPMSEFWIGGGAMQTCKEMASATHIYGKPILGAESFTAGDAEKWQEHPASIKTLGDAAFCDGVSRFVFHRYAMQPWLDRKPGMTMGPWGLHYERTSTWWDWSGGWHEYLARCQFMLRQGRFVADLCYLQPEAAPQGLAGHQQKGYDYDNCSADALLTRMSVKDGRLMLPDGMSYRLLVLPNVPTMTPQVLRKVKELVEAGAIVYGQPPQMSPSLSGYPACDEEVTKLASELWGNAKTGSGLAQRTHGKGRVFWEPGAGDKQANAEDAKYPLEGAKWIWYPEGKPASAAPVATRYFRRTFTIEPGRKITSARLVMTADNSFTAWINGRQAGAGDNFRQAYVLDVKALLQPGVNVLAVAATNGATAPNPAGLIGALTVRYRDHGALEIRTDQNWEAGKSAKEGWQTAQASPEGWAAAMDLGAAGMHPWGTPMLPLPEVYPDANAVSAVLAKMKVVPDFEADRNLRYIHRRAGDADIYFVANGEKEWVAANCTFRVTGKQPEIWDPITGRIRPEPIYGEANGRATLPLWLEPSGSVFVVFRNSATPEFGAVAKLTRDGQSVLPAPGKPLSGPPAVEFAAKPDGDLMLLARQGGQYELTAVSGKAHQFTVAELPKPEEITGSWEVQFPPNWGAPERVTFEKLISWSQHPDTGVKYFSGTATYTKTIAVSQDLLAKDRRLYLDLGNVQVMADVKLNGKPLGVLWKPPYRVAITSAARAGENALEVRVVNLWPNRLIGDEQLPEDSQRHKNGTLKEWPVWLQEDKPSPTGRFTFTTWRLWHKDSPLLESGLIGPVTLQAEQEVELK